MTERTNSGFFWYEKYFIWIVGLGALAAMALSLYIGLTQSVWFDEAYSVQLAKRSVGELIYLTSIDTHPPFYYLLLKVWGNVFGWSEPALRSLSVLAMGGSIYLGGLLVKRMFGVRAALATLPFIVLAPFLLRYGFEIRMYALASLIGVAATYLLVRAVESKRGRQWLFFAGYSVLVTLGLLTLYYTVLLWLAHFVWLLWRARHMKAPVFKQTWWLAYMGSALLFLPWLPTFLKQIGNGALAPIAQQLTTDNMIGIMSFWFLYQPAWQLNGLESLVIVAVITTLAFTMVRAYQNLTAQQRPYYMLLVFYVTVPVLAISLISLLRPMYVERYLADILIGFGLLIGVSFWLAIKSSSSRQLRLLRLGLIGLLCYGVVHLAAVGNYNFQRLQLPQARGIAESLQCDDEHPVVVGDPYTVIELSYYVKTCDMYFHAPPETLHGGYAPLAGSSLNVTDPATRFKSSKYLTYVFDTQLTMPIPRTMHLTKDMSFGAVHVSVFSAE